jgi:hypothetical protein
MSYNFKTVMGSTSYRPWKNWEESDYLVGKYVSQTEDNYGKPNYKVEVIEAGFSTGEAPKAGTMFTFNSSGSLNKAMDEVQEGDIIKVIYKGEDTISKGKYKGKAFHSMEVLVAPKDNTKAAVTTTEEDLF